MRRVLSIGLGALMTVAGVVFTLQGLGFLHGSSMTGVTAWAVLGPIIAIAGLALVSYGRRADSDG